jgi:magnesium chelatase subunit I
VDSMRAEITLFEAARAYTAADDREQVIPADIGAVATIALRLRHSEGLDEFHRAQRSEDERLAALYTSRMEALQLLHEAGAVE